MKLFEIDIEIEKLLNDSIDIETGEIKETALIELEKLELKKSNKALNIAKYIKSLIAESKAIKDAEKTLSERRKIIDNKINSITNYLSCTINNENYKDAEIKISWRKSKIINIINIDNLKSDYIVEKTTKTADKKAIKTAIDKGFLVTGAELIENNNIQIK